MDESRVRALPEGPAAILRSLEHFNRTGTFPQQVHQFEGDTLTVDRGSAAGGSDPGPQPGQPEGPAPAAADRDRAQTPAERAQATTRPGAQALPDPAAPTANSRANTTPQSDPAPPRRDAAPSQRPDHRATAVGGAGPTPRSDPRQPGPRGQDGRAREQHRGAGQPRRSTTPRQRARSMEEMAPGPRSGVVIYVDPHDKGGTSRQPIFLGTLNASGPIIETEEDIQDIVDEEDPPGTIRRSFPWPYDDTSPEHEAKVKAVVNYYLRRDKFSKQGTLQQRLEEAHKNVDALRNAKPSNSESIVLRDAEHYLWGRMWEGFYAEHKPDSNWAATLYYAPTPLINFGYWWVKAHPGSSLAKTGAGEPSIQDSGEWFRRGRKDFERYDKGKLDTPEYPHLYTNAPPYFGSD